VSGKYPPLSYRDVVIGLKALGFTQRPQKGTSHEQWEAGDPFRKVTVSKHHEPFHRELLNSMIKQAGVSKKRIL
jgi:predicted RNA binding protein YcfA (HicA-like mRNA interferase family)